ncbi:MAG: hypothetical protein II931_00695, partial [Clostridia bacterium]|nr:hypothetical protein [Clostridia bacterium]
CIAINFTVLSAKSDEHKPTDANRTYIVKNYEGKVACFEEGSTTPFMITEIYVINLPPLDREMLENGIEAVGAKKLSRVLEDYRT